MDYKLEEQHHLLRLNFAPQHIIDGKVIPAAISSDDLQRRGYSLDSEILISIETLTERAASQSAKKPEERKSPHISRFLCGEAASIKYDDIYAFNIFHSPVPKIQNIIQRKTKPMLAFYVPTQAKDLPTTKRPKLYYCQFFRT